MPAILNPFTHVPVHVMQTKRVRRKGPHGHGPLSVPALATGTIAVFSVVVCLLRRNCRAEVKRPRRPASSRELPLRLAQQPIALSRLPREPPDVFLCVLPGDTDDRVRIALFEARFAPGSTQLSSHSPVVCIPEFSRPDLRTPRIGRIPPIPRGNDSIPCASPRTRRPQTGQQWLPDVAAPRNLGDPSPTVATP